MPHTPGPWNVARIGGIAGVIRGGVIRKYTNGSIQDQLFMVSPVPEDNGGDAAQEANAALVAAAPDLLAALEGLMARIDAQLNPNSDTRMAARMAIAKARGTT